MQSAIRPADLLDLAAHTSRDESRPLLSHIYADPEGGCLVATNGHSMLVIRDAHAFPEPALIPVSPEASRFWKAAHKTAERGDGPLTVTIGETVRFSTMSGALDVRQNVALTDHNPYPRWQNVIPSPDALEPAPWTAFDVDKLAKFSRYGEREFGGYLRCWWNKAKRAILVTFKDAPDRLGLLMPVMAEDSVYPALGPLVESILRPKAAPAPDPEGEPVTSPSMEA